RGPGPGRAGAPPGAAARAAGAGGDRRPQRGGGLPRPARRSQPGRTAARGAGGQGHRPGGGAQPVRAACPGQRPPAGRAAAGGLDLDFAADAWKPARALMQRELVQLRETELVNYRAEAERAYETAVETFRSNVANTLHDNFVRLKAQIDALNRTLRNSPAFSNNERYRFHYEVVAEYRDLHRFIQKVADVGAEDTLFGTAG